MTKLITTDHKLNLAHQLFESIYEPANNAYYVCASSHIPRNADIPTPKQTVRETLVDVYHNLIFGKRVAYDDVSFLIRNIRWESKKYDRYDDTVDLQDKDFFCIVDEGALFHVFKCLDNNWGANSTVEPQFIFAQSTNNYIFETADEYKWKYMYSVTSAEASKFGTDYYFPLRANNYVQESAIKGAIDVIVVDGEGRGYNNYFDGTFLGSDLRIAGNNTLYKVSNDNIQWANGYYTGCMLYLSTGVGSGQYKTVSDYYSNSSGHYVDLESAFDIAPVNGTEYQVRPRINVKGGGVNYVQAHARAIVNTSFSNSIHKVEILNSGKNYDYVTATVVANSVVGVTSNAVVRPIYSPMRGHGANAHAELFAHTLGFSVTFANNEANTIPTQNKYEQLVLIKDPTFANVMIETANMSGTFLTGEHVVKIDPIRLQTGLNINTTSDIISGETSKVSNVVVISGGSIDSYSPNDLLVVAGGTASVNAELRVESTEVRTVLVQAAGDDQYTNGDSVWLTDGTASVNAEFTVTTNSTGYAQTVNIQERGTYSVNPTTANAATTTSGSGNGLTLNIEMGIKQLSIANPGAYKVIPTFFANNRPTGGSGQGAEVSIAFNTESVSAFNKQVKQGDFVYLTNVDDSYRQLTQVVDVINATHLQIASNGAFACTDCYLYQPNIDSECVVLQIANATHVALSNVESTIQTGDVMVGLSSYAKMEVNSISRNDIAKNFNTFNNLYKYVITPVSGMFEQDEIVFQGESVNNSVANARVHCTFTQDGLNYMMTSNQSGQFTSAINIIGGTSGAVATLVKTYAPELEYGVGEVLYIENFDSVERANNQSENFKLIFEN